MASQEEMLEFVQDELASENKRLLYLYESRRMSIWPDSYTQNIRDSLDKIRLWAALEQRLFESANCQV